MQTNDPWKEEEGGKVESSFFVKDWKIFSQKQNANKKVLLLTEKGGINFFQRKYVSIVRRTELFPI